MYMEEIIINDDVNAVIEALVYCRNFANGTSVSLFVNEFNAKYSVDTDETDMLFTPLLTLERHLNTLMVGTDMERIHFFFDVFDKSSDTPRGMNIANAIMMPTKSDEAYNGDLRAHVDALKELSLEDRIFRFRFSMLTNNEFLPIENQQDVKTYFDQVMAYPMSSDNKLKLLLAIRYFDEYAEELYGILAPLVEQIEADRELFSPLLDSFRSTFENMNLTELNHRLSGLHGYGIIKPDVDFYELYPRLFTIHMMSAMTFKENEGDPVINRIEIGILRDRVLSYQESELSLRNIAECVKALGSPARLEIMSMLRSGEVHVQGLVKKLGLSFTTVSSHMNKLMLAGLVEGERRGSFVYYSAKPDSIKWLIDKLHALLPE